MLDLDSKTTALVLIDLQKGILAMNTAPHGSADVLSKGRQLADTFRKAGAPVVLVNVDFGTDFGDAPRGLTEAAANRNYPEGWTELADGLRQPGDLTVTKHQWGAFHGTDLDVKLRRRGISTIVVGGIATNFGVESTARAGWEHGYNMVVVEDASTGVSADLHDMAFKFIFPRIARVTTTADINLG